MNTLSIKHRVKRFWKKFQDLGLKAALRSVQPLFSPKLRRSIPLASADTDLILATSVGAIRDFARKQKGRKNKEETIKMVQNISIPHNFPFEYLHSNGTRIHYAFLPALSESRGLVVIFHGYLGFEVSHIRYGWNNFDLLLPLDNFGWHGLGSWFWGEGGSNHVEEAIAGLVHKIQADLGVKNWFSIGASMGGFASLFHGIKYSARGIYAMTPIIDLKTKIRDYRSRGISTSYTGVADSEDSNLDNVPDVYAEAERSATLPPLFLIQNQYDRSNPFGEATLPLLHIYSSKKAWHGLRVFPSIGHQGHDGSYEEARYFFNLIAIKSPPNRVDFYEQDESLS